jgi:hypothetical protein
MASKKNLSFFIIVIILVRQYYLAVQRYNKKMRYARKIGENRGRACIYAKKVVSLQQN